MRLLSIIFALLTLNAIADAQVPRASVGSMLEHLTEMYSKPLSPDSNANEEWTKLYLLHKMLTVDAATQFNTCGGILGIPYVTNYGKVNVRAEVNKNGLSIAKIEYPPYESFAAADRTPVLFYTDLVSEVPYTHPSCGDFYTFGWCSEREMAFASAGYTLGFKPRIVVQGNHTFTLVKAGRTIYMVDNTYGKFTIWSNVVPPSSGKLEEWYNKQALVQSQQLWNVPVTDASWQRIENQLIDYLWPLQSLGSRK